MRSIDRCVRIWIRYERPLKCVAAICTRILSDGTIQVSLLVVLVRCLRSIGPVTELLQEFDTDASDILKVGRFVVGPDSIACMGKYYLPIRSGLITYLVCWGCPWENYVDPDDQRLCFVVLMEW